MRQSAIAVPVATMIIPATCGAPITAGRTIPRPRQESSGQINQALATLFNVASTTEISFGFFPRWWTRAASSAL